MTPRLHNELGRRSELARFGYHSADSDPARIWRMLRGDFPIAEAQRELQDLPAAAQAKAREYCLHRLTMDALMDRCDMIHLQVRSDGPALDVVETYAAARDEYEDSVERFGELRGEVQALLTPAAGGRAG